MKELIEKLEKATGPDRELDEAIVRTLCPNAIIDFYCAGDDEKIVFHAEPLVENRGEVPHYTSSIDAALPGENIRSVSWEDAYDLDGDVSGKHWVACHVCWNGDVYCGSHPTSEAIARRIAALRARSFGERP